MATNSSKTEFDIPVQFACPHCGDDIEVTLGRLQASATDVVCWACARGIHLNAEQVSDILRMHGEKLERLRATLKRMQSPDGIG